MDYTYTVDIFSGEPGESAQLKIALKNFGQISSDCSAEEIAYLRKFRPNRKKFTRNCWGET
jgi:hypothetical protein